MSGTAIISSGLVYVQTIILSSGTLYVFENSAGCSSYTTGGALISSKFLTGYTTLFGAVQLNASSFYVPDYTQNKVFKYSLTGVKDNAFNLSVTTPIGNTFYNNTYYVSSYPSKIVQTFNLTTGVLINSSFITVASGNILTMLANENKLYIGTDANIIYVYDATTGSVINSTYITSTINGPYTMICDYSYLYVTSYNSGNVDLFNLNTGNFVINLVSGITNPRGTAIEDGNIYVANTSASSTVYKKAYSYFTAPPPTNSPTYPCFLEGSKILRLDPFSGQESYVPVENLKQGDLIHTSWSGYKAIVIIGRKTIENDPESEIKNRLYRIKKQGQMTDDLVLTGEHCTLHNHLSEEKLADIEKYMGRIYITESAYYRVPAHLDERFEPYPNKGPATIWHFALEHDNPFANYGVYANGLLVESSSIRYMHDLSNMELRRNLDANTK